MARFSREEDAAGASENQPGRRIIWRRGRRPPSAAPGSTPPTKSAPRRGGAPLGVYASAAWLVLVGALLGALLLIVSELTVLYQVHTAASSHPVRSVSAGSNNAYALVPIAILAAFLGVVARRNGGWMAVVGLGILGVVALLIALLGDLPDARHQGYIGSAATHLVHATSTASAGMYMETLGAVILIATAGSGLLMLERPSSGPSG